MFDLGDAGGASSWAGEHKGMPERLGQHVLKHGPPPHGPCWHKPFAPFAPIIFLSPLGPLLPISAADWPGNSKAGKEDRPVKFRQ